MPRTPLAHDGQPLAPHDLWSAWSWEPAVVICLLLSAWLYARGARALWRSAGAGHGIRKWEAAAFAIGWLTLALALVSPLHRLGEVLFTAHMAQHELLMVVAAPLLVLGRPLVPWLWGVPISWRRTAGTVAAAPVTAAWKGLTRPSVAWRLHALAIWLWPSLEDQQLAGVIMRVPAGIAYLIATLGLAATWLQDPAPRPLPHVYTLR